MIMQPIKTTMNALINCGKKSWIFKSTDLSSSNYQDLVIKFNAVILLNLHALISSHENNKLINTSIFSFALPSE